ncbi:hypothetical protein LTR70_009373 [Exophiala xenobiotica]|uniref:Uncharacterized protein n=1 Tax=Lithohypha guttulata TaxID=1690604 RepID=A0ABR0JXS1_9EURO|nr:hypothetical protein LTR24_009190 [Lithohypha guttulata]KAK5310580.1 hypothetical protein LTR70_009373 [Exophiala xenobiotica]
MAGLYTAVPNNLFLGPGLLVGKLTPLSTASSTTSMTTLSPTTLSSITSTTSAASVSSTPHKSLGSLSGGAIAGIVVGAVVLLTLVILTVFFVLKRRRRRSSSPDKDPAPSTSEKPRAVEALSERQRAELLAPQRHGSRDNPIEMSSYVVEGPIDEYSAFDLTVSANPRTPPQLHNTPSGWGYAQACSTSSLVTSMSENFMCCTPPLVNAILARVLLLHLVASSDTEVSKEKE